VRDDVSTTTSRPYPSSAGLDRAQQPVAEPSRCRGGSTTDPIESKVPSVPASAPSTRTRRGGHPICAKEAVVVVAREGVVEQLHGHGDLVRPEQAGAAVEPLKRCALRVTDGTERVAHAPLGALRLAERDLGDPRTSSA